VPHFDWQVPLLTATRFNNKPTKGDLVRKSFIAGVAAIGVVVSACGGGGGHSADWNQGYKDGKKSGESGSWNFGGPDMACGNKLNGDDWVAGCKAGFADGAAHPTKPSGGN
jgi:hypothetical protein